MWNSPPCRKPAVTRRHYSPWASPDIPLGAEHDQRPDVQVHECILIAGPHAEDNGGDVEAEIEQQDDRGIEAEVRDEAADQLGGIVARNLARRDRLVAIGADAVFDCDKCPAMRAHAARIHQHHHTMYAEETR